MLWQGKASCGGEVHSQNCGRYGSAAVTSYDGIFRILAFLTAVEARSKPKQDKGGMPDKPGYRQNTAAGKGLPRFQVCYGLESWLRCVCQREGNNSCRNSFSGIRKVLPESKQPDSGFSNFLRTEDAGAKSKQEKGPAPSRRPWIRRRGSARLRLQGNYGKRRVVRTSATG